jgi:hypothetical protein
MTAGRQTLCRTPRRVVNHHLPGEHIAQFSISLVWQEAQQPTVRAIDQPPWVAADARAQPA